MKSIMKRLKSKAGETLVESMAAILIFTFASIIMLSMVSSAADINTAAKKADREYFEDMVVIEKADTSSSTGSVHFTVSRTVGDDLSGESVVDMYVGTHGMYAYYAHGENVVTPEAGGDET